MTENELKKHLEAYTVRTDEAAKQEAVNKAVSAARHRFVPMSIKEFVLNQIHYIKPHHWLLCLTFIATVPVVAFLANEMRLVLFISLVAPLLSALAVQSVMSQMHSGMMELESSLLYKASTVFSARLLIYGVMSTACILISSLFTSLVSGSFLWILLFETMLFTVSALVSMLLSFFIKNEYAPYVSIAVAFVYAFAMYSYQESAYRNMADFSLERYISVSLLAVITAAAFVLLTSLSVYLYKHYNFNGGLSYGN